MANISDLLIGGDLIDQQLTEFLDPALKTQNEIARRTSAMLTGVTPESPGAPSAQMAARLTAQGFENLRQGLAERNPQRFATDAELFQQQVQGLDLANPAGRAAAVAAARRINPARAMQLAQAFRAQDIEAANAQRLAAPRTSIQTELFDTGAVFRQDDQGGMTFLVPEKKDEEGNIIREAQEITDPLAVAHARGVHASLDAQNEAQRELQATIAENAANAMQERLTTTITQANGLQDSMRIYDRMIEQIEENGATPGWIDNNIPDLFRSGPNKEFTALAAQLGLALVGRSNFGQLNESELRLALTTEMPRFNNQQEYLDFLNRQKAATQKLINETIIYANYLKLNQADVIRGAGDGQMPEDLFTQQRQRQQQANSNYPGSSANAAQSSSSSETPIARSQADIDAIEEDDSIPLNTLYRVELPGQEPQFYRKGA